MKSRPGRSARSAGDTSDRRTRRTVRDRNELDDRGESVDRSGTSDRETSDRDTSDRETRRRAREDERARVSRSRKRAVLVVAAVLALIVGGVAVAYLSPVLTVRSIDIDGAVTVPEDEIVAELGIPLGEKLVRVDAGSAAQRVAAIPALASVRVQRIYPSTVRVTVVERVAVVFVDEADGTHLLDSDAVDFAVAPPPPGVVRLVTENPASGDPATTSALAVLDSLPPPLRDQVGEVRANSPSDVSLSLLDGRTLVWGDSGKSERKSAVALALLSQPGQILDVSSPDLPTTK